MVQSGRGIARKKVWIGPTGHGPPRPLARTTHTEVTSPMGEDDPYRVHLAHGRGRPTPWSPRPWVRTTDTKVASPMGEDNSYLGPLAHGGGRPAPGSARPWARTTSAVVTSPMGEDNPHRGHLAHGRGPSHQSSQSALVGAHFVLLCV
ncbi:hypothetical protein Bca101_082835 [Brassica carinata]